MIWGIQKSFLCRFQGHLVCWAGFFARKKLLLICFFRNHLQFKVHQSAVKKPEDYELKLIRRIYTFIKMYNKALSNQSFDKKSSMLSIAILIITLMNVVKSATTERYHEGNGICGATSGISGLIVGGEKLGRGKFPWLVALMYVKEKEAMFSCGASLISTRHILTGEFLYYFKDPKAKRNEILSLTLFNL